MTTVFLEFALAGLVAAGGYVAKALAARGALAATLVGGAILAFGGILWALLLVFFFVSSSALSFLKPADARKRRAAEIFEKGGRRDAGQVLANGGVPALLALASAAFPADAVPVIFAAFVGGLSAATADTWATEIGTLSTTPPVMITTGAPVEPGLSGGVTWLGLSASVAGAFALGLAALVGAPLVPSHSSPEPARLVLAAAAAGIAGSLVDSLAGATVQARYRCPVCDRPTESPLHRCGNRSVLVGGFPFVTNDLVNLAATAVGAVVGGLAYLVGT